MTSRSSMAALNRDVTAVAAESVFRGWDAATRRYREVPEADRKWLLGQLNRVRDEYRLPVVAIDYVADCGAYPTPWPVFTGAAVGVLFPGPYRVPTASFRTKAVYTSTVGRAAYRGRG